jgi:hypothetical protein
MPGLCLSQLGGAPVVPHGAGTLQGLMGRGSPRGSGLGEGVGGYPGKLWDWLWAEVRCGQGAGILAWCGSSSGLEAGVQLRGRYPGSAWIWCGQRIGDPAVCGSGTGLWPGAAQGVESLAE